MIKRCMYINEHQDERRRATKFFHALPKIGKSVEVQSANWTWQRSCYHLECNPPLSVSTIIQSGICACQTRHRQLRTVHVDQWKKSTNYIGSLLRILIVNRFSPH